LIDGLTHVVLHILQVRERHRNGIAFGTLLATLAGQYGESRGLRIGAVCPVSCSASPSLKAHSVPAGVYHIEILAGTKTCGLPSVRARWMLLDATFGSAFGAEAALRLAVFRAPPVVSLRRR
jgi:hypothetical protein